MVVQWYPLFGCVLAGGASVVVVHLYMGVMWGMPNGMCQWLGIGIQEIVT